MCTGTYEHRVCRRTHYIMLFAAPARCQGEGVGRRRFCFSVHIVLSSVVQRMRVCVCVCVHNISNNILYYIYIGVYI